MPTRFFIVALFCLIGALSPAHAQNCNGGNPWMTQWGTMPIGDLVIYGPGCNQFQDGGASPASATITPISAARLVGPGDCGTLFLPSVTNTQLDYAITLPASGTMPNNCQISIAAPSNRGVQLIVPSFLQRTLWPAQTIVYRNNTTAGWLIVSEPGLLTLSSSIALHVNHTFGTDLNNDCFGTLAGACQTVAGGALIFQQQVNCHGFQPGLQIDDSSFVENTSLNGVRCGGANNLQIVGNPSSPDSVLWSCNTAGTPCLNVSDHAAVVLNGFKLQCSTSGAIELQANQGGLLAIENIDFGTCGGGILISCAAMAQLVDEGGTWEVSATTFSIFLLENGGCSYNPGTRTISVPNVMAFGTFIILENSGASAVLGVVTFSGAGAGAGSTGTKYQITGCASMILSGTILPGATAGSVGACGQVTP